MYILIFLIYKCIHKTNIIFFCILQLTDLYMHLALTDEQNVVAPKLMMLSLHVICLLTLRRVIE